ncbi:MAG: serine/threonine protein phosphatase [Ruminococcaceae bacterium]|nr:serine/threonine protein phosphatase [Oscillospiraceae bacterium]
MALFAIADLHLSSDGSKSMEVFGSRWTDYMQKIKKNWTAVVDPEDTVIVPGDISWGLKLEDARNDLLFLDSLPGTKLIGKGNHDFWWSTASKMRAMMEENDIRSIRLLYNNAYLLDDCIVCGTRGWFVEENQQHTVGSVDYNRIVNREVIRLRMSLDAARKLQRENGNNLPVLVFLHFPPVWNGFVCREIVDVLHEYGIKSCYFGHIHGAYYMPRRQEFEGIEMILCAADAIGFSPMPIYASDF